MSSASFETLIRRAAYGGKKGRAAARRLKAYRTSKDAADSYAVRITYFVPG